MKPEDVQDELVATVRKHVDAWFATVEAGLRRAPTDPHFPTSVLLLAPIHANEGSSLVWATTVGMSVPGQDAGWMHALQLSRDMLLILAQMDAQFKLGIPRINELVVGHPLLRNTLKVTDGSTITDMVEDGASGQ